jgi:hypothetical protein
LDAIWDAIKRAAQWLSDFGEALGKTVFDFLVGVVTISGTVVSEPIKFVLYLLNKWLFTVYRQFRDVLVLAAYHIPFTEELAVDRGASFNTTSLWRSRVDLGLDQYPQEEIAAERAYVDSSYAPFRPPITQRNNRVEQPPVGLTAPYKVHGDVDTGGISPTLPDDFIDTLSGKDDMFLASGPEVETSSSDPRAPHTFASDPRNFGNALANCIKAIAQVRLGFPPPFTLPDYNLDGDRGYAWPCWDVSPQTSPDAPRNPNDPLYPTKVPDPLSPTDARNSDSSGSPPVAHVNAVPLILQDPNVVAPGSFDPTI